MDPTTSTGPSIDQMRARPEGQRNDGRNARPTGSLALGAIGVVFGDIGTSPLYTLKTVLDSSASSSTAPIIGVVSLIVWTLLLITSGKYAAIAMRIDNDGEGGILALMALLGLKRTHRPLIVALGLFGAALIYGDGAITPAISVLSALEGLEAGVPSLTPYVLPIAIAILVLLFAVQPFGSERIGRAFGPIMLCWFAVMAVFGALGIARNPAVLAALNPWHGLAFLAHSGVKGFLILGGVFLCVTGAEALYADMGHFGARPIRRAWSFVVFPALVLNYCGQGAILMEGVPVHGNIFYALAPQSLLMPMVLLSTVATVIASQSIITGAFSMTRQAIELGWMPRLKIVQTSEKGYGQIYVGGVNWLLMLVTVGLALGFRKSDNLAGAYGIAVSMTMLLTTSLLFLAMREIWKWSLSLSLIVSGVMLVIDLAFFASNLAKLMDGGYVPLLAAIAVYLVMTIWHRGMYAVVTSVKLRTIEIKQFLEELPDHGVRRVPGTAVFLTRVAQDAPPLLQRYVRHTKSLHSRLVLLTLEVDSKPWVSLAQRLKMTTPADGCWSVVATYGFMEHLRLDELISSMAALGCQLDVVDVTYFVSQPHVRASRNHGLVRRVSLRLFALMLRNGAHMTDYLQIPGDRLVELGTELEI